MAMEEELDLNPQDDQEKIDRGGRVGPGLYVAVLDDVEDKDNDAKLFLFKIAEGPFSGSTVRYFLPDWHGITDDKKAEQARHRTNMIALRMNAFLLADLEKKKTDPNHKIMANWIAPIGRTFVVEVDADQNGYMGVTYSGIYPTGHKDLAALYKRKKITPPASAQVKDAKAASSGNGSGNSSAAGDSTGTPVGAGAGAGSGNQYKDLI